MDGRSSTEEAGYMASEVEGPYELLGTTGMSDGTWSSVGQIPSGMTQGWKLYVSATLANFVSTLKVVAPIFHSRGVPFKYLANLSRVRDQNAGIYGYSQVGKCIVAYLHDVELIQTLVADLKCALDAINHEGPFVPRLPRAWCGSSVFYRYGGYRDRYFKIAGESFRDNRSDPLAGISRADGNPFPGMATGGPMQGDLSRGVEHSLSILTSYPVIEPICRSGKGGVFRAIDLTADPHRNVIVKLGLRLGSALPDGRDGAHFLSNEWQMYCAMRAAGLSGLIATPVAFSSEPDANVLVLDELPGVDLMAWRTGGGRDIAVLSRAIKAIRTIHETGFCLGDAKGANMMYHDNGLTIFDLEASTLLNGSRQVMPSTFFFGPHVLLDRTAFDLIHFLASLIFRSPTADMPLSQSRLIDMPAFINQAVAKDEWDDAVIRMMRRAMLEVAVNPRLERVEDELMNP